MHHAKASYALIALLCLAPLATAFGQPEQAPSGSLSAVLELHFGGPGSDGANQIIGLADGGFALGGWKGRDGQSDITESWVIRVDNRGAYIWDLPLPSSEPYGVTAMSPSLDGGIFTVDGDITAQRGKTRLSKLAPEGVIEWQLTLGNTPIDKISAVRPTFDGGLILVGQTYQRTTNRSDGWVMKLDRDQTVLWFRVIDAGGHGGDDALEDIIVTTDGTYLAVGWATDVDDNARGWVTKLSLGGATLWQRFYSLGPGTELHRGLPAPSSGAVFAATATRLDGQGRRVILGGLDQEGTLTWQQGIASQKTAFATGLARLDRSTFLLAASIEDQDGQAGLIVTFSNAGTLKSIQRHSGSDALRVLAVAASGSTGYAAAGSAQRSRSLDQDVWLLINPDGRGVGPNRPAAVP